MENTYDDDNGANLLDCYKALKKYKYISEDKYPYDPNKVNAFPSKEIYMDAFKNVEITGYATVPQDLYHIRCALAINKQPIVIGAMVYNTFQQLDANNVCPTPDPTKDTLLGGHALLIFSYDDTNQTFGIVNSWGDSYGCGGTFNMKYDYVLNPSLVTDLWTLNLGFKILFFYDIIYVSIKNIIYL